MPGLFSLCKSNRDIKYIFPDGPGNQDEVHLFENIPCGTGQKQVFFCCSQSISRIFLQLRAWRPEKDFRD
ncbi:MAG: hypothetical protein PHT65_09165, partial [Proteiniphilum sp.]|nr:hypothetical protein [Proteiniphilum sp.]